VKAEEESADAVVAKKRGNARGAKGGRNQTELERGLKGSRVGTGNRRVRPQRSLPGEAKGRSGGAAASQGLRCRGGTLRNFGQTAMYENLMEEVISPENYGKALKAVMANKGSPGMDGMTTEELNGHLLKHWPKIYGKLLEGS